MGKVKKKTLANLGKPRGISKLYSSKDITECCVPGCKMSKRNDKIKSHQMENVLFGMDGKTPQRIIQNMLFCLKQDANTHTFLG